MSDLTQYRKETLAIPFFFSPPRKKSHNILNSEANLTSTQTAVFYLCSVLKQKKKLRIFNILRNPAFQDLITTIRNIFKSKFSLVFILLQTGIDYYIFSFLFLKIIFLNLDLKNKNTNLEKTGR